MWVSRKDFERLESQVVRMSYKIDALEHGAALAAHLENKYNCLIGKHVWRGEGNLPITCMHCHISFTETQEK